MIRSVVLIVVSVILIGGCAKIFGPVEVPVTVSCAVTNGETVKVIINGRTQSIRLTDDLKAWLFYPEIETRYDNNSYRDCGSVTVVLDHPRLGLSVPKRGQACTDDTKAFYFDRSDFSR